MKLSEENNTAMMTALLLGGFLSLFNETLLNVALPKIMEDMNVSAVSVQWLSTGYMLIVAVMVPLFALLAATFPTRRLYMMAMTIFLIGTAAAAAADDFQLLLFARMLQAVGTGLLAPIMINSSLAVTPVKRHGYVMGLCTGIILIGPALGPIASGAVLSFFSWHALFIMLIPMIFFCMFLGHRFIKNTDKITRPKIDFISVLFSSAGFALIIYGMSVINIWQNVIDVTAVFAAGILILILFTLRQLSLKTPILNLRVFAEPYFSIGAVLVILIQMVQFSLNITLPMLFENGLKVSSFGSAMLLFPGVLVCSLMTAVTGKIYDRIGGRIIIPMGILIMCVSLALMSSVKPGTPMLIIAAVNTCVYFGISLAWSPNQSSALSRLALENHVHGVTVINTFIQLGSALGTPLFVGLMEKGQNAFLRTGASAEQAIYHGFSYSVTVAAVITGVAFAVSVLIRQVKKC